MTQAMPPTESGRVEGTLQHQPDPWTDLRAYTTARLALGRSGNSLPTDEVLRFGLAHAQARDAVHLPLDVEALERELVRLGCRTLRVRSAAADRQTYLLRPDLGRRLASDSTQCFDGRQGCDLAIIVGDGLSALAVQRNAAPLIEQVLALAPPGWTIGPVVIATQARVALGDEVGESMGARFVAVLIGERPGLGSPDSLGVYLTAAPRVGRMDSERNCISNIRREGLDHLSAARRLWWLCGTANRIGMTGVGLKDDS
jgi:ethanolamine ammonia-lyase small subunit